MVEASGIRVDTREDLVALLYEAAELEHGLACSYRFAAFSLKTAGAEGITDEQAEAIDRWRTVITDVVRAAWEASGGPVETPHGHGRTGGSQPPAQGG